jgi:hypothetical protein
VVQGLTQLVVAGAREQLAVQQTEITMLEMVEQELLLQFQVHL